MTETTRRDFTKAAAYMAVAAAATGCSSDSPQPQPTTTAAAPAAAPTPQNAAREFPKGYYWGVATASYQIEGAWNEDGKGLYRVRRLQDAEAHAEDERVVVLGSGAPECGLLRLISRPTRTTQVG